MNPSRRRFLRKAWAALAIAPFAQQCVHESIAPVLHLLHPNGGEALQPRSNTTIRWESKNISALLLEFSSTGGSIWTKIAEEVPAEAGFYDWQVPLRNSAQCLIRISDNTNPAVQAESAAFFSIRESYDITLDEHPELKSADGFKVFDNTPFGAIAVLVTAANTFKILSLNCTHAGCAVEWQGSQFECPCHFSVFSKTGCVLNGPAQLPLWQYAYNYDTTRNKIIIFNNLLQGSC